MGRDYYIFANGRIRRKDNTIYFIDTDDNKKGIPIEDIERLHLFGEVDFNTKFLNYISKYSILISIYNYYGFYSGTYYSKKKNLSGVVVVNQAKAYLNDEIRLTVIATGFEEDNGKITSSTSETTKIESKPVVEPVKKEEEPVQVTHNDPLLDLDRESVNIPSFLRSRK
mgnify:CR=1 FL=1